MNRALLLFLMLLHMILFSSSASAGWKFIGQRDMYRVVLIEPEDIRNTSVYWDALRQICRRGFCNVIFVSDENAWSGPQAGRMTCKELDNASLIYTTTGGFAWNCQLRPDADNCFKW